MTHQARTTDSATSLPDYLAARARAASDTRLALDAIVGLVIVVAFSTWRIPAWYLLAAIGACFLSYGTWAIANRELAETPHEQRRKQGLLKGLSMLSAVAGFGAAGFLMLAVVAKLIGRVIS